MTLTRDLTDLLVTRIASSLTQGITIVDGRQRDDVDLPCVAVVVTDSESHSVALPSYQRCSVEVTMRSHAGDSSTDTPDAWGAIIEESLQNPQTMKSINNPEIQITHWAYNGTTEDWDESVHEVIFSCECIIKAV